MHGETLPFKKSCSLILRCSVSKEPTDHAAVFVTTITLHRLSAFASGAGDFFHGKATSNVLKQNFDVSENTHFVPISQETP